MNLIRVGVVGLGIIAERVMQDFAAHPAMEITAVCDRNADLVRNKKKQLADVWGTTDYRELVQRADVDLVYVATPPSLHAEIAIAAMKQGKHVLSEKPLANSLEEASAMCEAARAAGVVTAMNFPLQYSPQLAEFEHLVKTGFLGELRQLELVMHFPQWPRAWQQNPWVGGRQQGGFTLEVGVHFIQSILRLFGPIQAVAGRMLYPHDPNASEIGVVATATVQEGVSLVVNGLAQCGPKERIEFTAYGSEGSISLRNWSSLFTANRGQDWEVTPPAITGYGSLVENVVHALRGQPAHVCDFQVGYDVQVVLEELRKN